MSFTVSGIDATVPLEPATPVELPLVEQVAHAMDIFVVAHGSGHHDLGHGRDVDADAQAEEYEADQLALRICRPIGEHDRTPLWNPYLASGSGAVIVLKALEALRRVEHLLVAPMPPVGTHPTADERVARFDSVAAIQPGSFRVLKGFRTAGLGVMEAAGAVLDGYVAAMAEEDRKQLVAMRRALW